MDRVRQPQQLLVTSFLGFRWKLCRVLAVQVVECLYRFVARPLAIGIERLEHAAADDFVGLVAGSRQPGRLHPPEYLLQAEQCLFAPHAAGFGIALRQRADDQRMGNKRRRFGQRLDEGEERFKPFLR